MTEIVRLYRFWLYPIEILINEACLAYHIEHKKIAVIYGRNCFRRFIQKELRLYRVPFDVIYFNVILEGAVCFKSTS